MEITDIKVFPIGEQKLKAFVSIVFDECFMVNDIKVIQGKEALFISMPSRRKRNGKFKDVAHPLNNETRQRIERQILAEYWRVLADRRPEEPASAAAEEKALEAEAKIEPVSETAPDDELQDPAESMREKSLEEVTEMHLRDSFWST